MESTIAESKSFLLFKELEESIDSSFEETSISTSLLDSKFFSRLSLTICKSEDDLFSNVESSEDLFKSLSSWLKSTKDSERSFSFSFFLNKSLVKLFKFAKKFFLFFLSWLDMNNYPSF